MRCVIAWATPALVGLVLLVAAAQQPGQTIRLRQRATPAVATYRGFVQVFSHVAITVRDPHNRNALRTFTFSSALRQRLEQKHLDYGEPVKVTYRLKDEVALRLAAKFKKGS